VPKAISHAGDYSDCDRSSDGCVRRARGLDTEPRCANTDDDTGAGYVYPGSADPNTHSRGRAIAHA